LRTALDLLAAVPDRRRRVKALQVTGFTYAEIGERLGLGYTRVNAPVTEANAAIHEERERAAQLGRPPRSGSRDWTSEAAIARALRGEPPSKPPTETATTSSADRLRLAIVDEREQRGWTT